MADLIIIDALNWMNSFFLFIILFFLTYWYTKIHFSKKEKVTSAKFFWSNFSISFILICFLIWSWITFYFLEEIYSLNNEQINIVIKIDITFCLFSVIINVLFVVYILIFSINFFLIIENKNNLILGFKKINLNNLSFKNKKIYFKEKNFKLLIDYQIKKQVLKLISNQN